MAERNIVVCVLALFAGTSLAVDFTGPGGDMADRDNWGGTLPTETTAVNFPPSAVPAAGLTLSAPVAFGATTIPAGFADGALFDLAGFSYKGAALSVKSPATFQNGFFTNKTLSVAANAKLTVSGAAGPCELRLTGASTPYSSGAPCAAQRQRQAAGGRLSLLRQFGQDARRAHPRFAAHDHHHQITNGGGA